jgi:phosphohistidine phosphatase
VETSEIVAESLDSNVPMDFCDALRPSESAETLISFLAKRPNRKRVLVVGHEPDLSNMAGRLIGAGRHANLAFKKGGCCLITFDEFPPKSPGSLVWWLTPRLLRKLG